MMISSSVSKLLLFAISASLIILSSGFAATDEATVNVTVQTLAQISVQPKTLNWTVYAGQAGTTQDLEIINTGSVNVTQIYAYVDSLTDETERPYGSSNATKYAAGGVIVFKNETYDKFFFAGRIEWNWTEDISNMDKSNVNSPIAWGFFKNTSLEYLWLLGNGTNGYCNNSNAQFAIEYDVDNGTVETRTPETTGISFDGGDVNYGYFSINRAPLHESCIAAYYNCSKIYIYKYDKRQGFTNCLNSNYIQENNLPPSNVHTLTLNVYVPLGIPAGNLNTATFTVYATG